jgi:hypothetical protein
MKSTNHKLRLAGALAVLATLALAVSCQGFFPKATYTSLAIQPSAPQIPLEGTESFQVFGSDTNGHRAQITSGASWSMTAGTTGSASIVTNTGVATGQGVGAVTVNVSFQGLNTTASGVVYLANISSICVSTVDTQGSCSSSTEQISSANPTTVNLFAIADYTNGNNQTAQLDITTSATWTVSGPNTTDVTCSTSTSPAVCTINTGAAQGNYVITVSYPQTSITAINTIQVGP